MRRTFWTIRRLIRRRSLAPLDGSKACSAFVVSLDVAATVDFALDAPPDTLFVDDVVLFIVDEVDFIALKYLTKNVNE